MSRFFKPDWHVQSHDFRTSWATECFKKSKNLMVVSKYLGHKSIGTTEAYVKLNKSEILNQAAETMMQ